MQVMLAHFNELLADPATLREVRQYGDLGRQTFGSRFTEFQGFSGRLANLATGDPPQNETAAPTGIGSGDIGKLVGYSEIGICAPDAFAAMADWILPIIAKHFGLDPDDAARAVREAGQ